MHKDNLTSHINDWHFDTTHSTSSIMISDIIIVGIVILFLSYFIIF